MTISAPIKRVITCNGTIQLITALSVLNHRQKEQYNSSVKYENYLVIYDLYAPVGQVNEFVAFIKKMAKIICDWQAIAFITPLQFEAIAKQLNPSNLSTTYKSIYELVGTNTADEIYLCRNWLFSNKLLINAYCNAKKICYGDSIGVYFSSSSTAFFATSGTKKSQFLLILDILRLGKANITNWIKKSPKKLDLEKIAQHLENLEFDKGYFVLPDVFGEIPPMPVVTVNRNNLLNIFQKLKDLADLHYIARLQEKIADRPVSILLTSNLSEAGRMSEENEINAYRQFLISEGINSGTFLVIKPHPRDNNAKLEKLSSVLTDLFADILILSEPHLFFLPFEIFFLEAFSPSNLLLKNQIRVFAVSSACLSLKLLFGVPSSIGFGSQITSGLFYETYAAGRLVHEEQLKSAIKNIY